MDELLEWMDYIEDNCQQAKVRHKLKDIIAVVLFATLANVDDWVEMAGIIEQKRRGSTSQADLYRWKNNAFQ